VPVVFTDDHFADTPPGSDPLRTYPSPLAHYTAGFVSPATGQFVPDPSAQGGGMPFQRYSIYDEWAPVSYDPVLKRWLPVQQYKVSPDHHAYVYTTQSPLATGGKGGRFDTTTLWVYDITTGKSRSLWTSHDQIDSRSTWEADGIHTTTIPQTGGHFTYWLVNPTTGAVAPDSSPPANLVMTPYTNSYGIKGASGGFGTDGAGHPILLEGTRDPGSHQEYFVGGPNGQRIVIHDGVMGDAFDFDPDDFTVDGDRLWAANYDATALWLWTEKDGLKRIPLTGITQHDGYITPQVVGPCR
jgi:hypothetical protein